MRDATVAGGATAGARRTGSGRASGRVSGVLATRLRPTRGSRRGRVERLGDTRRRAGGAPLPRGEVALRSLDDEPHLVAAALDAIAMAAVELHHHPNDRGAELRDADVDHAAARRALVARRGRGAERGALQVEHHASRRVEHEVLHGHGAVELHDHGRPARRRPCPRSRRAPR
jgi:hypothetical protein